MDNERDLRVAVRGLTAALALTALLMAPQCARACACGCGVFDLGTQSMFPTREGWMFSLEYDFMNQNRNWAGEAVAPAVNNDDRQIRTTFVTFTGAYEFKRKWSLSVEAPYWQRLLRTSADAGATLAYSHAAIGDVRVRGTFTGFSPDLSTGLSAGLKLPTGDFTYSNFDRDTEIGTGSTDLLVDAYHLGPLTPDGSWGWFAAASWDQPFTYHGAYQPGRELDATAAAYPAGWGSGALRVAPVFKVIASIRAADAGAAANPQGSGYRRAFVAPGLDARVAGLRVAADVYVPLAQHVNGNQLLAPALFKLHIARAF